MLPLIGSILLSAVGQLGVKLAIDVGKKLFGPDKPEASSESFSAQLKRQIEKSGPSAPAATPSLALAQLPVGLQAPAAMGHGADGSRSVDEAVDAYQRFEAAWPGRSVSTRLISPIQTP